LGRWRSSSPPRTSASSDAIDELDENAIVWAGSTARAKARIGRRATIASAGYNNRTNTMQAIE
jgi:hypothetical protein